VRKSHPTAPKVSANFAITADGRISTRSLTPSDFSSPTDKRRLLELRAGADAIVASARTVGADGMTMGLPPEDLRQERIARGLPEYPLRVLLSNSGRISPGLRVFQVNFSKIILFSTTAMPKATQQRLRSSTDLHLHDGPGVDLRKMLLTLRSEYGVRRLVCEGGGQIFRSFLGAGLVDELYLTLCPRIFGGLDAPTLTGTSKLPLPASTHLRLLSYEPLGSELFLRYRVIRPTAVDTEAAL
jgi:riboflavin-specific deaminase-like protein